MGKVDSRPHGYVNTYTRGCRCRPCTDAAAAAVRDRVRRKYYQQWGTPDPRELVDATPARNHLASLISPMTHVAATIGIPHATLYTVRAGRTRLITRRNSDAILGYRDPCTVTPIGLARRLRALARLGYRAADIAAAVGCSRASIDQLRAGYLGRKPPSHAADVVAFYESVTRLSTGPQSTRVRNYAERQGWAPPAAWDDDTIDDPTATPHGIRHTQSRTRAGIDEVLDLLDAGTSPLNIAERLGVRPASIARRLRRHGHHHLAHRFETI
ncbi:hypothetical protein ACTND8_09740 [Atopobiaceae bacterium HCP3S3_F7]|uniref:hypothetical protein n=2 Tax=unclassified Collinsella TaxID=2637548 RepID=UPI003F8FE300